MSDVPAYRIAPWRGPLIAGVIVVTLVFLGAGLSPASGRTDGTVTCTPHCIEHVVVVVLENAKVSRVLAQGTYLDYVWHHFGRATSYYAVCHPSAANYLAMTSGRSLQCGNDNHIVHAVSNIADLLGKRGFTWKDYDESMPHPCYGSNSGEYVVRHDPFVSYRDIVNRASACDRHVVNSSGFNSSVARGTLSNYSFYSPNLYDDGHTPASVPDASRWLQGFLGPILNHTGRYASSAERAEVNHTAFLIVYDESSSGDTSGYSAGGTTVAGGHVYLSVVSPYSHGLTYAAHATHYNLESTVEWLFHTGNDGGFDGTTAFPAMTGLFSFGSNGY